MTRTDPILLIAAVLPYASRKIHGSTFSPRDRLMPLIELGVLVPAGYVKEISCNECDECHLAPISHTDSGWVAQCDRIGSEFEPEGDLSAYRVDAVAFAQWLSTRLGSNDRVRLVPGLDDLWTLGVAQVPPYRMAVYFTPSLRSQVRTANVFAVIEARSRAIDVGLIVADEAIDCYRLPGSRIAVLRLRDVVRVNQSAQLVVDRESLMRTVIPEAHRTARGAPPFQRERIVAILDELAAAKEAFDRSNASCRNIGGKFASRYDTAPPAKSTIIKAIDWWNANRRG